MGIRLTSRRALAGYAAWMALLVAAHYALPGARAATAALIGVSAAAAMLAGVAVNRPGPARAVAAARRGEPRRRPRRARPGPRARHQPPGRSRSPPSPTASTWWSTRSTSPGSRCSSGRRSIGRDLRSVSRRAHLPDRPRAALLGPARRARRGQPVADLVAAVRVGRVPGRRPARSWSRSPGCSRPGRRAARPPRCSPSARSPLLASERGLRRGRVLREVTATGRCSSSAGWPATSPGAPPRCTRR